MASLQTRPAPDGYLPPPRAIILPDATILLTHAPPFHRYRQEPHRLRRTCPQYGEKLGLIYSQRILLALVDKGSQEEAWLVQPRAMERGKAVPFKSFAAGWADHLHLRLRDRGLFRSRIT